MPVVAFARSHAVLAGHTGSRSDNVLIQVSDAVARRLEAKLGGREGRLSVRHLPRLRELATAREFDADLRLLIGALEADASLYVRLL
jgi:hypothetical protein